MPAACMPWHKSYDGKPDTHAITAGTKHAKYGLSTMAEILIAVRADARLGMDGCLISRYFLFTAISDRGLEILLMTPTPAPLAHNHLRARLEAVLLLAPHPRLVRWTLHV